MTTDHLQMLYEEYKQRSEKDSLGLDREITDSRDVNNAFIAGKSLNNEEIASVLKDIQRDSSILTKSQDKIRNDISRKDGGNEFLSALLVSLFGLMSDVRKSTEKCSDIAGKISDNMKRENSPDKSVSKEEKESALNDLMRDVEELRNEIGKLNSSGAIGSLPQSVSIDQGIEELNRRLGGFDLTRDDFDSPPLLISQSEQFISKKILVATQLGDRYYSLSSETPSTTGISNSVSPSFRLVDEATGEVVLATSGYDSVSVDGDIITMRPDSEGLSGREIKLRIQNPPANKTPILKNKTRRYPSEIEKPRDLSEKIKSGVKDLDDKFGFELWACLLLDLASLLKQIWDRIRLKLKSAMNIFNVKKDILGKGPFGSIPKIGRDLFFSSPIISEMLNSIINPSSAAIDFLGARNSFINPGSLLSGSSIVCSHNKTKYCNLSQTLTRMIKNLMSDLDRVGFNLGKIDKEDLGWDLDGVVSFMNGPFRFLERQMEKIDVLSERIEGDICNFIEKRLYGEPKSVTGISGALIAMTPAISAIMFAATPFGIGGIGGHEETNPYMDMAERLENSGYNRAADLLRSGRIVEFLSIEEGYETYEGAMAHEVEKIIKDSRDIDLKSYMIELLPVLKEKTWEKTSGQRFRRNMIRDANNRELNKALIEGTILAWVERGIAFNK